MTRRGVLAAAVLGVATTAALAGCTGRTDLFRNDNPALRKSPPEFAADAAGRFPFPTDVPAAEVADVRGEVDYTFDRLKVLNFGGRDWQDVELWVNRAYVVYLPVLPTGDIQDLNFRYLYNDQGQHFPLTGAVVDELHLLVEGELLEVSTEIMD